MSLLHETRYRIEKFFVINLDRQNKINVYNKETKIYFANLASTFGETKMQPTTTYEAESLKKAVKAEVAQNWEDLCLSMQEIERQRLRKQGYAFIPAESFPLVEERRADLARMADEWNRLQLDNYLKNQASFRERRYGRYAYHPKSGRLHLLNHKPYFQSANTNQYAGGIARKVAPLTPNFCSNPLLADLVAFDFACFPTDLAWRADWWFIACHMFRIIGRPNELGEPTPEGVHRDDIDFGTMHLMRRDNAEGGLSRIHNEDRSIRAEICLQNPMDTLFWADRQILHSVTPITPRDETKNTVRDILILGFSHTPDLLDQEEVPRQ